MTPGSIGDPDVYLGNKLRRVRLSNGVYAWANSSSKYVQELVRNTELLPVLHTRGFFVFSLLGGERNWI